MKSYDHRTKGSLSHETEDRHVINVHMYDIYDPLQHEGRAPSADLLLNKQHQQLKPNKRCVTIATDTLVHHVNQRFIESQQFIA